MQNSLNRSIYRLWAPLYDAIFGRIFKEERRKAIAKLNLKADERLLIPGLGTGLDLPFISDNLVVIGGDYSLAMLNKAHAKITNQQTHLHLMDAQALALASASVDGILLSLILSVVPNGAQAFSEAWRALKPGGQIVIFDKFLPESASLTPMRRFMGWMVRQFGTDPNRYLTELLGEKADLIVEENLPSLLRGQYRIVVIRKMGAD